MLQIILTIVVWFRGWKWLALLPMAGAFVIGLFIGMSGGTDFTYAQKSAALIADGLAVLALIIMCFVKPKVKSIPTPEIQKEKVAE